MPLSVRALADPGLAGRDLRLMIWNIGYAGLGRESDFRADGGRRLLPPSRADVRKNLDAICAFLAEYPADVLLLQEVARRGPLTLWHEVLARLDAVLPDHGRSYSADIRTPLLPPPLGLSIGKATYARFSTEGHSRVSLPGGARPRARVMDRTYGLLRTDLPMAEGGRHWVFFNVHLSAFDPGAALRRAQLAAALAAARRAHEDEGHFVVLGGDWNLELVATAFPHTTRPEHLFWRHPFPQEALPDGWRIAADPRVPSVRTNERPYVRGENCRFVIDGYILSPNVELADLEAVDLDFGPTDHHPVLARLRARL